MLYPITWLPRGPAHVVLRRRHVVAQLHAVPAVAGGQAQATYCEALRQIIERARHEPEGYSARCHDACCERQAPSSEVSGEEAFDRPRDTEDAARQAVLGYRGYSQGEPTNSGNLRSEVQCFERHLDGIESTLQQPRANCVQQRQTSREAREMHVKLICLHISYKHYAAVSQQQWRAPRPGNEVTSISAEDAAHVIYSKPIIALYSLWYAY